MGFVFLYLLTLILFDTGKLGDCTDYCELCENKTHTLCKFKPGPGEKCNNYGTTKLTWQIKNDLLNVHNEIRNYIASGHENRGNPGPQPNAANMMKMKWSEELSEIAQRWADQCILARSNKKHDECRKTAKYDVGQNVVDVISKGEALPDLKMLISDWYEQIDYVNENNIRNFSQSLNSEENIDSYSQLVWAKSEYVGCGYSYFKTQRNDLTRGEVSSSYIHKLVCNYGPGGNVPGSPIYEIGKPCSQCEVCDSTYRNLCTDITLPWYKNDQSEGQVISNFYSKFPYLLKGMNASHFNSTLKKPPYEGGSVSTNTENSTASTESGDEATDTKPHFEVNRKIEIGGAAEKPVTEKPSLELVPLSSTTKESKSISYTERIKVKGIWLKQKCRCTYVYRSDSFQITVSYVLLLVMNRIIKYF